MKKLALLLFVLPAAVATAQAQTVTITSLTDLGPGVVPNAINNNGVVVGQNASGQAFVYQGGTMTPIGTLGGSQSAALDINDGGTVVGWANLASGLQHGFTWTSGGNIVDLNPGISYSFTAAAINTGGEVVGWAQNGAITRSILWGLNGTTNYMFGTSNKALGINNKGEVVGVRLNSSGSADLGYYWNGNGGTADWTTSYIGYYPFAGINNNSLTAGRGAEVAGYLQIGAADFTPIGKLSNRA